MEQINHKTNEDIRNKIMQFIVDNFLFNADSVKFHDDDSFLEEGIIDSTGVLELIEFIEENFNFKVEDDELIPENLDTINNVVSYINRKIE